MTNSCCQQQWNIPRFSCKALDIFFSIDELWIFMTDFNAIVQYQISQKIFQWEPSSYMWTDMMKLICALCDYSNVLSTH
jgi:hypothetical protein